MEHRHVTTSATDFTAASARAVRRRACSRGALLSGWRALLLAFAWKRDEWRERWALRSGATRVRTLEEVKGEELSSVFTIDDEDDEEEEEVMDTHGTVRRDVRFDGFVLD